MPPPASFSEALRFLDRFCLARNIVDQSHTALAAVLLFQPMDTFNYIKAEGLQLPAFIARLKVRTTAVSVPSTA